MVVTEAAVAGEKRPGDTISEAPGTTTGSSSKRQKSDSPASEKPPDGVILTQLPTDLLARCLTALGSGHYRFVAGSCKALREAHEQAFGDAENRFVTRGSSVVNIDASSGLLEILEDETTSEHKEEHVEAKRDYLGPRAGPRNITKTISRVGALGCTAASFGNLPVLEHLVEKFQKSCAYEVESAGRTQFHLGGEGTKGYAIPMAWTESAAGAGQLDACKWIHDYIEKTMGPSMNERCPIWYRCPMVMAYHVSHFIFCVYAACKNEKWPVLRWALRDMGKALSCDRGRGDQQVLSYALEPLGETADMEILRWCVEQKVPEDYPVEWLRGQSLPLFRLANTAARARRLDILAVLRTKNII